MRPGDPDLLDATLVLSLSLSLSLYPYRKFPLEVTLLSLSIHLLPLSDNQSILRDR